MTWFKVDDHLAFHPKVIRAGNAALGLWVRAGSWSAAHLTDGFVPAEMLAPLGARRSHATELVKAGLWSVEPEGYRFHDWHEYQPSANDVQLVREKKHAAGVRGSHERWHVRKKLTDPDCEFCQSQSEEAP